MADTPTDGSRTAGADGGQVDASPLETLESSTDSDSVEDHILRRIFVYYIYTPASIMRSDWRAQIGSTIVLTYLVVAVIGPIVIEPTYSNEGPRFLKPFSAPFAMTILNTPDVAMNFAGFQYTFTGLHVWEYPFGTDNLGQDLFARTVHSTRPVMQMMLAGGLFTVVVGTSVGLVAGYKGGVVDTVLSTFTDIFLNIPGLPLVIVLAGLFSPSNPYLIGILLAIAAWAGLARAIRSQVLTLRQEPFTEAARTMGLPTRRIVSREVLPHLMPYVSVNLVKASRDVIFSAVGLYFIGVLPFDHPNWGVTMNLAYTQGAMYRMEIVHWLLVPMFAIIGISMGMILLAQSLDRVFNPRVRAKHADTDVEDIDDAEEEQDVTIQRM